MAHFIASAARNRRPAIHSAQAGQLAVQSFKLTMTAAFATADTMALCKLPAGHVPVDLVIDWPDMDSGANLDYDIGLYALGSTDGALGTVEDVDCFIDGSTVARSVGRERIGAALQAAVAGVITPSDVDRVVGVLANTGGAGTASKAIRGWFYTMPAGLDD